MQALEPAALYVPAAQAVHAVALPEPYVPEGQAWHEVDTPSTKYWPAVQQTDPPLGVQRIVPPVQVIVGHFISIIGTALTVE